MLPCTITTRTTPPMCIGTTAVNSFQIVLHLINVFTVLSVFLLPQVPGMLPPAPAIPGLAGLGASLGLGGLGAGLGGLGAAAAIDPLSMAAAGMSAIGGMAGLGALSGAAGEGKGGL